MVVLITQIAFLNSISGVDFFSNFKILGGLVIQTYLGGLLLKFFLDDYRLSIAVEIGGGFVLGLVPVLLLGRGSGGLLLMAVVLFFLAYHRARVKKYDRRNTVLNRDLEAQTDLVVLAIALVIVNLVFLRISQYAPGIAIFIASLGLIGVPHKFLSKALGAYFISSFAILVARSLQIRESAIFTHFRFFPDWTEEQVLAQSLATTGSLRNPFLLGDTFSYHFLTAFYWGTFEKLTRADIFSFSGPTLLSCAITATVFLLTKSALVDSMVTSSPQRFMWLLALFGSWPFWDSFVLDNISRSQSLSIAVLALVVFVMTQTSARTWLLLIPALCAMTFLTKVSTGLFVCVSMAAFVIIWLIQNHFDHNAPAGSTRVALTRLAGLLLAAVAVLSSYLYVFVFSNSSASHGALSFGWYFPDVYTADRNLINQLQYFVASLPLLVLLLITLVIWRQKNKSEQTALRLALITSAVFTVFFWQVMQSASGVRGDVWAVGVAAIVCGPIFFNVFPNQMSYISRTAFAAGLLVFTVSFAILERRPAPHQLVTEGVLAVAVVAAMLCVVFYRSIRSFPIALLLTVLCLNFGNSLGHVAANRTNGVLGFHASTSKFDTEYQRREDAIHFLQGIETTNVYAVEDPTLKEYAVYYGDSRIRHDVNWLMGAVWLQFWAEPHYANVFFRDSKDVRARLMQQSVLTQTPTADTVQTAKLRGITHVILFSPETRDKWATFINQIQKSSPQSDDFSTVVYSDSVLEIVQL